MAKENTVYLYGRVLADPRCLISPDGTYLSGKVVLHTLRRSFATSDLILQGKPRWDCPCVLSRNPKLIKNSIVAISEGDLVLVKGTLCTQETKKKFLCPVCNHETVRDGVVIYIDPIFVKKLESLPEEEGFHAIEESAEISNQIMIMGTLCREPTFYEDPKNGNKECTFQIASNRIRRILEDNPEKRTDYPWVKTYGSMAEENASVLHTNSSIYINGAIEVRQVEREIFCEECGEVFKRNENTTEIVPYHVEYLENCMIPKKEKEEEFYAEP